MFDLKWLQWPFTPFIWRLVWLVRMCFVPAKPPQFFFHVWMVTKLLPKWMESTWPNPLFLYIYSPQSLTARPWTQASEIGKDRLQTSTEVTLNGGEKYIRESPPTSPVVFRFRNYTTICPDIVISFFGTSSSFALHRIWQTYFSDGFKPPTSLKNVGLICFNDQHSLWNAHPGIPVRIKITQILSGDPYEPLFST